MKNKFIINQKGKKIVFREREIRTPVTIEFDRKELPLLLMQVRFHGITDYKVEGIDERVLSKGTMRVMQKKAEREKETFLQEPSVDELDDPETQSLLDKLAKG